MIIFEGWCVGYKALSDAQLEQRYAEPSISLAKHDIEDLKFINYKLREYDLMTDCFDAFVHIDADPEFAYDWREQQEDELRKKGSGMTKEEVTTFMDGYFPAYELYLEGLRRGVFLKPSSSGMVQGAKSGPRHLKLVVGKDRKVVKPGGISYLGS